MNTDFNKKHVVEFKKYLTNVKRYSKNTIDSYISSICKFFNYCKKDSERIYSNDVVQHIKILYIIT